ncbi:molybdopterin-dependent oxidoreductase [Parasalinivibrio latis]|uniref:molybdopterin-dependent oxidoreductase n=1 Tax=Parasalinivibrio latis TaxID=2952610 RepID=UPI0030DFD070
MPLSRRDFLKSALATAVAANGLSLFPVNFAFADDVQKIPSASHWGPFYAIVKNGELIGIQPREDIDPLPTEMLIDGLMSRTFSDTRIKYPMVRKSYLENLDGDTKPELRGKEPFVRVSWETALQLTADAILRTIENKGNQGIFDSSYDGWSNAGLLRPPVVQGRFFNLIGGASTTIGDYSAGASTVILPHVVGNMEVYSPQTAWPVIEKHTEVFVLVGCDPWKTNRVEFRVADHQMQSHWLKWKEKGIRFISINPKRTTTDRNLGSEWVEITPGTDTALFNAMAYHLHDVGLVDYKYLEKYTVGYQRYLDYLTGKTDGTAKTPDWAAAITGISADEIRQLAELFRSKKTQLAAGWALQRADHGEMVHWAIINFAAMAGKIGKPGEGFGFSWHYGNGGMPQSGASLPVTLGQGFNAVTAGCPVVMISEMLKNPGKAFTYNGATLKFPDISMIYNSGNNLFSHQQNLNALLKAMNDKVETYVCQDTWWCASARFADIVLPATSALERDDITSGGTYSNDKIYAMRKVIEPLGESLDDWEIFRRLSAVFHVEDKFTDGGKDMMTLLHEAYGRSSAAGIQSFDAFWENGVTHLPVPKEADMWQRHGAFYNDPEKNPLHTPSGKIELFSEAIAGMHLPDCPPVPTYMPPFEFLGNAEKGQLHILSPHPWMRLHSQMANADTNKYECVDGRQYLLIHEDDAKEQGIEDGDIVELFNDRGALLCGAKLTNDLKRGVACLHEGAWLSLDKYGRCNSGQINIITSDKPCGGLSQGTSANTCLAYYKKCTNPCGPNEAYQPPETVKPTGPNDGANVSLALLNIQGRVAMLHKKKAGNKKEEKSRGEELFYSSCTMCHAAPNPSAHTRAQWEGITNSMFPRAGLSAADRKLVLEYLYKHAAKS